MPNLTNEFPKGVNSIQVGNAAGDWQAYTAINYSEEPPAVLNQGQSYNSPADMGLTASVKSIKKAKK